MELNCKRANGYAMVVTGEPDGGVSTPFHLSRVLPEAFHDILAYL